CGPGNRPVGGHLRGRSLTVGAAADTSLTCCGRAPLSSAREGQMVGPGRGFPAWRRVQGPLGVGGRIMRRKNSTWRALGAPGLAVVITGLGPAAAALAQGVPSECNVVPGQCCAGRPSIDDSAYQSFGQLVTVGTAAPAAIGTPVVAIFD